MQKLKKIVACCITKKNDALFRISINNEPPKIKTFFLRFQIIKANKLCDQTAKSFKKCCEIKPKAESPVKK